MILWMVKLIKINCKLMKLFMLKELDKILVSSKEKNYAGNLERD